MHWIKPAIMKYKTVFKTGVLALSVALLVSCGSSNQTDNADEQSNPEVIKAEYTLDASTSSATWERTLDQKATKQKVKMFGQMVEVELGAVKLNSNGSVSIQSGTLTTKDEVIAEATAIFDMASFKIAQEKGNGLFDVQEYPSSTLKMTDFTADSTGYVAKGELTIQGANATVDINLNQTKTSNGYNLTGSLLINTMDFPLRDQVTAKDINKDEIVVTFELRYAKE